ncbi:hypothetical protein ABIA35_004415 [Catenulispora sp. MAP12-49]|uniref:cellulase family glycosylhydrolase n=1 Tax=unclassified Catenulispora TaxID=414885 RepID=UPI0035115AF7
MANSKRRHWAIIGAAAAAVVIAAGIATAVSGGDPGQPSAFGHSPAASTAATTDASGATPSPGSASGTAAPGPTSSSTDTSHLADMKWGLDYSDTLTFDQPDELNTALDDAKKLGMDYIRVDFGWEDYQSFSNYAPDFSKFDRVVAAANARGLKVLATLGFPPPWARRDACKDTAACPPADSARYANFLKQAAARYSARGVHYWEVWNEPNLTSWAPTPDAADYTKLLVTVSSAIRAADPHAFILMGGLAATHPSDGSAFITPYDFITAVAKAGGLKAIDGISYHPYPDGDPATSKTFQAISQSPTSIVAALNQVGAPNMPIWITETGSAIPAAVGGTPEQNKSQEAYQVLQAKREVDTLASYPNVTSFFWFSDQDVPADHLAFGLRRADGTFRPAFYTLQQIIANAKKAR